MLDTQAHDSARERAFFLLRDPTTFPKDTAEYEQRVARMLEGGPRDAFARAIEPLVPVGPGMGIIRETTLLQRERADSEEEIAHVAAFLASDRGGLR